MKLNLKSLITLFVVLWVVSAIMVLFFAKDLQEANNFGGSFGAVSALFSGLALALAIYSMLLQQKQSMDFEKATLAALEQQSTTAENVKISLLQQANAIKLIEMSLTSQAAAAKVNALSVVISQEEQRIETLKQWGEMAGDMNKYSNGIKASQKRLEDYQKKLREFISD
ncbi:hypothetical protein [Comamonas fluminis]|jgi:hypothetical protein|uniref:hypothetical protein n=1 Tax=Comamonas fluminis TaxID=2796366 RepID=UPI001C469FFD|nr:hypothetical protein [Comamonas fluminis]